MIQSLQWIKSQAGEGEINLADVLRYPGVVEAAEQDLDAISQDLLTALMNCWWNLLQCVGVKAKNCKLLFNNV